MWPRSSHGLEKAFPQVVHTHGKVCERMCIFSAPRLVYSFGQCLQRKAGLAAVAGASRSSSSSGGLLCAITPVHFIRWRGANVCTGSGLGGSEVRPSSSSPQLLALLLRLEGELRSRGPGMEVCSVWEAGRYKVGRTLKSHTRPVVRQVAVAVALLSADGSSAKG